MFTTRSEPALETRNLSKDFGGRAVLRRIDLTIPAGQCVAFMGANGAGKTTLLRCLASLVRPTSGVVLWCGQPVLSHPDRRRLIGMVAHETRLYPHLSLGENVVFAARMYGVPEPVRRTAELLEQMGLERHTDLRPPQVSRGMQQRLALTRALVHDPPILLLDEPFSGLDADGSRRLMELLLGLRERGTTVCFTSHDEAKTERLAHAAYELQAGRLQPWERDAARLSPLRLAA